MIPYMVNILSDREPVLALVKSSLEGSVGSLSVSCCLRRGPALM